MQIVEFKFRLTKQPCTTIKWWIQILCSLKQICNKPSRWFKSVTRSNPWTELQVQSAIRKTISVLQIPRKLWWLQGKKINSKRTNLKICKTMPITRDPLSIQIWWACIRLRIVCFKRLQPNKFKLKETITIPRSSMDKEIFHNSVSNIRLQIIYL